MAYLLIKFALSAALIVAVSEIARRNSSAAALLALPLLLRAGADFWLSLLLSCALTALASLSMVLLLKRFGIAA